MGPGTIEALEALLAGLEMHPDALLCSPTDADGPGDRFADRHRALAKQFQVRLCGFGLQSRAQIGMTPSASARNPNEQNHESQQPSPSMATSPHMPGPLKLLNPEPKCSKLRFGIRASPNGTRQLAVRIHDDL
jgi:hypothetical protein